MVVGYAWQAHDLRSANLSVQLKGDRKVSDWIKLCDKDDQVRQKCTKEVIIVVTSFFGSRCGRLTKPVILRL